MILSLTVFNLFLKSTTHFNLHLRFSKCNGATSSTRLLDFIGSIHDIESWSSSSNLYDTSLYVFTTHWGHLSVIFLWVAGSLFHIGWSGNYSLWRLNPVCTIQVAHSIWDPHFASSGATLSTVPSYSGIYNWLLAAGFTNEFQIYRFTLGCELLGLLCLLLAKLHLDCAEHLSGERLNITHGVFTAKALYSSSGRTDKLSSLWEPLIGYVRSLNSLPLYLVPTPLRLNFHIASLLGTSSIAWAGHLIHVSLPSSRSSATFFYPPSLVRNLYLGAWSSFASNPDTQNHVFGSEFGAGTAILSFSGQLNKVTSSLNITDIAHHHLAIGVLCIWGRHVYSTFRRAYGHRLFSTTWSSSVSAFSSLLLTSLNLQLTLALLSLAFVVYSIAYLTINIPAYPYLAYDYVTLIALFIHHNWVASPLLVGAFSHLTLLLLRDFTRSKLYASDTIDRLLSHKASLTSHLSWVTIFLGFHTLGVYVHNDAVVAFGQPYKQLLLEPTLAQSLNKAFFLFFKTTYTDSNSSTFLSPLAASCPGDFLAAHSTSLGLHVTSLVLIKGSLDSRGSALMPDKSQLRFGFSCDGPSRGGTCDISGWDAFYLAFFWMLNANSWLMFYTHWKSLLVWQGISLKFEESSNFLNGWFRDYLWFNSGSLIRGYDALGSNDIAVWSWAFLAAHLCWATGFMFLISWRGYWQELVDVISFMHIKSPFLFDIWDSSFYSPSALSIIQARFIGLAHFAVGLIVTYAAFVLGTTS